jgi:hypothetical protein
MPQPPEDRGVEDSVPPEPVEQAKVEIIFFVLRDPHLGHSASSISYILLSSENS